GDAPFRIACTDLATSAAMASVAVSVSFEASWSGGAVMSTAGVASNLPTAVGDGAVGDVGGGATKGEAGAADATGGAGGGSGESAAALGADPWGTRPSDPGVPGLSDRAGGASWSCQ